MCFIQTSTLPPSMHQKFTEHGRCCVQKSNSLPKVMLSKRIFIYDFPLVILHAKSVILSASCGACSVWNQMKRNLFRFVEAKIVLKPLDCMPKWVWPSINQYRIFLIQTSTLLPPDMDRELNGHGTWKVLYAKRLTLYQKSCWDRW